VATKHKTKSPVERFLQARVPEDLYEAFARVARSHERSVSGELRHVMQQHVDTHDAEPEPRAA